MKTLNILRLRFVSCLFIFAVYSSQALSLSSPTLLGNNNFQFTVNGNAGDTVSIDAAVTACGTWSNIASIILPVGGIDTFLDSAASGFTNRFYRASVGTNDSSNAIGFMKLTIYPGFNLIANQLDNPPNTITSLITNVPDGTTISAFKNGRYSSSIFDSGEWQGNPSETLKPGEGAFIRNTSGTNFVIKFVGEVLQGTLTTPIPAGFSILSEKVPCAGPPSLSCNDGDIIFTYVRTPTTGYASFVCDGGGWQPFTPALNIGQAFFYRSLINKNWVRNFSVWQ